MNHRGSIQLFLLAVTIALNGCVIVIGDPVTVPANDVPASDLLLNEEPFPRQWQVNPCDPYCDGAERADEAGRTFGIIDVPGHVVQHVYHYGSVQAARKKFRRSESTKPYPPPPVPLYESVFADEQYLRCEIKEEIPDCHVGLRYGSYFVYFYFILAESYTNWEGRTLHIGLSFDEVDHVLRAMDQQFAEQFDLSLPK